MRKNWNNQVKKIAVNSAALWSMFCVFFCVYCCYTKCNRVDEWIIVLSATAGYISCSIRCAVNIVRAIKELRRKPRRVFTLVDLYKGTCVSYKAD